ncbi:MAG: hypothetical protein HYU39_08775 [Thaumarchaeota archaeon]|nr:hypothetical protein [Nitrososphaerota archaeon]
MSTKKEWAADNRDQTADHLRGTLNELAQLSELEEIELSYAPKLVDALKFLLSGVDQAISLNHDALGRSFQFVKEAYLVSDAVIIMKDEAGSTLSKPLSQFDPENILSIVQDSTPEIRRLTTERRKIVHTRIQMAEKMLSEYTKAKAAVKSTPRTEPTELDAVQSSIANQ